MSNDEPFLIGESVYPSTFHPGRIGYSPAEVQSHFEDGSPGRAAQYVEWRQTFYPGQVRCDRCCYYCLGCDISTQGWCSECRGANLPCRNTQAGDQVSQDFLGVPNIHEVSSFLDLELSLLTAGLTQNPQLPQNFAPSVVPPGSNPQTQQIQNLQNPSLQNPQYQNPEHQNLEYQNPQYQNPQYQNFPNPQVPQYQNPPAPKAPQIPLVPQYQTPGLQNPPYQDFPNPQVPQYQNLPAPQAPQVPLSQDLSDLPDLPDLSDLQGLPDFLALPDLPDLPDLTSATPIPQPPPNPQYQNILNTLHPEVPQPPQDLQNPQLVQPAQDSQNLQLVQSNQQQQALRNPVNVHEPIFVDHEFSEGVKCKLCASYGKGDAKYRKCNWRVNSETLDHFGCTQCRRFGLICIVEDIALPPRPDFIPTYTHQPVTCAPCVAHGTRCDRLRPCEACVLRGNPLGCVSESLTGRGTVDRNVSTGHELYPYVSSMRGGPEGLFSYQKFGVFLDQPADLHIQYARWVNGGPLPIAPGFLKPRNPPPRPAIHVRVLRLAFPARETADPVMVPYEAQKYKARRGLTKEPPPNYGPPRDTRYVEIPDGDEFKLTGLEEQIFNLHPDRYLQRPASPGPTIPLYYVGDETNFISDITLPDDDPEHTNFALIKAQRPDHPNREVQPALATVPAEAATVAYPGYDPTCLERVNGCDICGKPASQVCSDITHDLAHPLWLCDECVKASKEDNAIALDFFFKELRAYACSVCSAGIASQAATYHGRRAKVWGVPPDAFYGDNSGARSISKGPPLAATGCSCAVKLLDVPLCRPHRLEHLLDVRSKSDNMKKFVLACFGRMVCPFCLDRVGADKHNFKDSVGNPTPLIVFICLACLGFVLTDPATHETALGGA